MNVRNDMLNSSEYDLLCKLNENIRKPSAGVCVCIYNGIGHDMQDRRNRCQKYSAVCSKCIEDMLNEESV